MRHAIPMLLAATLIISVATTNTTGQNIRCDSVYTMVDEVPMFKNGYEDLAFYISKLEYGDCEPSEPMILTWTIDVSGQMIDIDAPGLKGECRTHIVEQLEKFPKWTPAKLMGVPVCFKMKLKKSGSR